MRKATMEQFDGDRIPYLRFSHFPNNGRVQHAVFTRLGGTSRAPYESLNLSISVPDEEGNVFANRALAYGSYGRANDTLVHAHLKHGSEVVQVSQLDYGRYVGPADGLITNRPACGLTMNYADCAPILLYDPVNQAIGLGHAGWKGAVRDLPGALVKAMHKAYGSQPADLIAAIGPCIGPCCYEVDEPVISAVEGSFSNARELLKYPTEPAGQQARPYFDLPAANLARLIDAGVEQIEVADLCTACRTDLFFSHRAEQGRTGRFGVLLILGS